MYKLTILTITVVLISGCATIFKGSNAEVRFNSSPANATISINGIDRGSTPIALNLKRDNNYVVNFKKEGYEEVNIEVNKSFDAATTIVGNLFSWWLLGVVVDVASGAAYSLTPADIQANMDELRASNLIDENDIEEGTIHVVMMTKEEWEEVRGK